MNLLKRNRPKIFCVGANKTGTTSVEKALKSFGYKIGDQVQGERLLELWYARDFRSIINFCNTAEAFQDVPFSLPFTYIALDQHFTGAKFILTERDTPEQWYRSLVKFHSKLWADGTRVPTATDLKNATYRYKGFAYDYQKFTFNTLDDDLYNEDILKTVYNSYNEGIKDYFRGKPEKLIVINVSQKNDYQRLCGFLNVKSTENDFPWENKTH